MTAAETLVILAGGMSSRMKKSQETEGLSEEDVKQANTTNKGMIGIGKGGRPLMDYLLFNAYNAGLRNVIIVTGEDNDAIKNHYGKKDSDNDFHGLNISYAVQYIPEGRQKPYGTADALLHAFKAYPELKKSTIYVCNSDNLYSKEVFVKLRECGVPNALINYDRDSLKFPPERIAAFAVTNADSDNYLIGIIEKPPVEEVDQFKDSEGKIRVSMNIFRFSGEMIYPYILNCPVNPVRDEKELPTAILNMIKEHPKSFLCIPHSEHVPDLTEKKDIKIFREYLEKNYPDMW
jgi:glucose-1-phosphate adenylyltransferase